MADMCDVLRAQVWLDCVTMKGTIVDEQIYFVKILFLNIYFRRVEAILHLF